MTPEEAAFEAEFAERAADEPALVVDVEGFEGPLDLLLMLARQQKVDLAKISILALADQYLAFIEEARRLRLELAADYLVMAAWLAYLKSRLLLPETATPEGMTRRGDGERARAAPQAAGSDPRRRAEAVRAAAARPRRVRARRSPSRSRISSIRNGRATLYDLLTAYASQRQKTALSHVRMAKRAVWSLAEAREALERLVGAASDWTRIDEYLIAYMVEPSQRATVLASSFASALELVREGVAEIHQQEAFAPLFMRKRETPQNGNGAAPEAGGAAPTGTNGVTRRPSAMSLATRKIMPRNEPEQAAEVRPEELRLLEAMLFASSEPIDEKDLAARLPEGTNLARGARAAARGLCQSRRQSRAHRRQVDVPHRDRPVVAAEQGNDREAQALARRDRDAVRSSPITSR